MKRILLIAALCLAPLPLGAQGPGDAAQRIEAAKRRAQETGVPVSLLESKVAEGRAKSIPVERIAAAVEQRLVLLSRARDAMAGASRTPLSAADLKVGADALAAGVGEEALGALTRSAPGDRRAVAIAVLAQLVQEGDRPERALERVRLALGNPESLRTLPGQGRRSSPPLERGHPGLASGGGVGEADFATPPSSTANTGKRGVHGDEKGQKKRPRRP